MSVRVFHLSDFHMGHGEAWDPLDALVRLLAALEPELLVVTGDVAHRGRRSELVWATVPLQAGYFSVIFHTARAFTGSHAVTSPWCPPGPGR